MYNKSKFKVPSLELEITLSHTLSVFWYNERPSIARWKAFHFLFQRFCHFIKFHSIGAFYKDHVMFL